jgi:hypothetical protein
VDLGGVCSACSRSLEGKRYAADLLVNVPFVLLLILAIALESKGFAILTGIYLLIVLKWSWGLGYLWADDLLYGGALVDRLSRFEPPGDAGTTRLPAGLWHCLVRLAALPTALIGLLLVGSFFAGLSGAGKAAGTDAATNQIRSFLLSAKDVAVPVGPQTLELDRIDVPRADFAQIFVYVDPSKLQSGRSYQLMTGPQLLTRFVRSPGRPNDVLFIEGSPLKGISRKEATALASTLPAAELPDTPPLRRP